MSHEHFNELPDDLIEHTAIARAEVIAQIFKPLYMEAIVRSLPVRVELPLFPLGGDWFSVEICPVCLTCCMCQALDPRDGSPPAQWKIIRYGDLHFMDFFKRIVTEPSFDLRLFIDSSECELSGDHAPEDEEPPTCQ